MSDNYDTSCIICMREYDQVFGRKTRLCCNHCICITYAVKSFITLRCFCHQKQTKHIHCAVCRFPSAKNDIIFDELDVDEKWNPPEEDVEEEVAPGSPLPPPPAPPLLIQVPPVEEVIVIDDNGAAMESVVENILHPPPEIFPAMDLYYQLVQNPGNNNYIIAELEYLKQLILQLFQH